MKKFFPTGFILIFAGLLVISLLGGCSQVSAAKLKVVTGSTLLAYIAQQIAGDRAEITNLIPASQHPGDFNAKPGDIETLSRANLFLLHGWPGEGYADKMISSANNSNLTVIRANVNGNWMIPSIQIAAVEKIRDAFIQIDSAGKANYQKAAADYISRIQAKEIEIKNRLEKLNITNTNVISTVRQADFLQWAGFKVTATYISPDALTPQAVKDLVDQGRQAQVKIIVNNLQDSADAGKSIAEELGIKSINLSNFPGGFDNTSTWEQAIDKNIDLLLGAMPN